ncbi:MAG: FRG domain-containing protein [Paraglaciecola sp.]|uniref:FRG domain-containing protein n=1 Tax=Paraglaciecola sp. TaxID=1920173 RepID=UPI00329711D0
MEALSTIEYLELVTNNDSEFFRGQGDQNWLLLPSLARIKNPQHCYNIEFSGWADLEEYLLDEFMNQSAPHMNFEPKNKIDWLVHAQHHGLPTKLMDWTTNPLKALFFAVEDFELDDQNGAVFLCNSSSHSGKTEYVKEDSRVEFFFSSHLNTRIVSQEGCFSSFPFPFEDIENFDPFEDLESSQNNVLSLKKILIPSKIKPNIRTELHKLGVNHRSIYPGLDGVSKTIVRGFSRK